MHSVINISYFNKTVPGSYEVDKLERVIFPVGIFFFYKIVGKNDPTLGMSLLAFYKIKEEWHC